MDENTLHEIRALVWQLSSSYVLDWSAMEAAAASLGKNVHI